MPRIAPNPVTLFLTPSYNATNNVAKTGRVRLSANGFDLSEFNLLGKTVCKTRSLYTDNLAACTGMVVLAKKLNNLCHENSSNYTNLENTRQDVFDKVTRKILDMLQSTKDNVQIGLFGGWGNGSSKRAEEIEQSHNLFNNIALCIEDELPETEGLNIPLLTVWGKLDSSKPDAIYARENSIVLINEIFKKLFDKDGNCEYTQEQLKDFLSEHYEEVLIPQNVVIIPEANYQSLNIQDNLKRKEKLLSLTV